MKKYLFGRSWFCWVYSTCTWCQLTIQAHLKEGKLKVSIEGMKNLVLKNNCCRISLMRHFCARDTNAGVDLIKKKLQ